MVWDSSRQVSDDKQDKGRRAPSGSSTRRSRTKMSETIIIEGAYTH